MYETDGVFDKPLHSVPFATSCCLLCLFMCAPLVSMCCKLDVERFCVAVATKMKGCSREKKLESALDLCAF